MNKELIKKYKPEFEHWLAGGTILYKHKNSLAWWITDCWDYEIEYVQAIIINDECVEFRKALVEGKTVQYNFGNYGINRKDFPNTWKDLDISVGILADRAYPDNYRIKPDEPKFKVGDWVIITAFENKQLIVKYENHILKENVLIMNNTIYFPPGRGLEYTKIWQPQPGEWCYFWDDNYTIAILAKFSESIDSKFIEHNGNAFSYCQPFTNELPTHLKDK